MPRFPVIAFVLSLGLSAHAGYTSSPGFYALTASSVPSSIRRAAGSVFQIRVLMANDPKVVQQHDVSGRKGAALKAKVLGLPAEDFDHAERIVIVKQIERCERFKDVEDQKSCPLILQMDRATAFLAGDAQTLWTNFHPVDHYLNLVEKYGQVSKADQIGQNSRLAVYVFDSTGALVVDPSVDDVHFAVRPQPTAVAKTQGDLYAEDSDYLALKLSRPIGQPLKLAKRQPLVGEATYIVGYPYCTGCSTEGIVTTSAEDYADRAPFPNSDGRTIRVAIGQNLSLATAAEFMGVTAGQLSLYRTQQMLFNSADSVGGASGSPILNADGDVLGINAGGKTKLVGLKYERMSRGVLPPEFLQK